MLDRVVKIQSLAGLGPAVIGQTLDPHGPVSDDQCAGRLAQPPGQRFRVQLFPQGVHTRSGGHGTTFRDDGPSARSLAAVV